MSKPATPAPGRAPNSENASAFGATDLLMLLAVLVWAFNFSVVKIALREFTPHGFNGPRLTVASLLLLFYLWRKEGSIAVNRSDLLRLTVLGIIGNTLYQFLFINGISRTTASSTSIILTMTPILIALLSAVFMRERIPWVGWTGILLSFGGLTLVIFGDSASLSLSAVALRGNLIVLAGNLFWAIYTVFSKPLLSRMSPLKLTSLSLAIGTFFYLPLAARDLVRLPWASLSRQSWGALVFSAVFAIALSYVIWYSSVQRVGNTKTGIFGNITPILTVFFAHLFLSETVSATQILGTLVIILGFYLTRFGLRWLKKR